MEQKRAQVVVNQPTRSEERLSLFNMMLVLNVENLDNICHSLTSKTLLVEEYNLTFFSYLARLAHSLAKGNRKVVRTTSL